MSSKFKNLTKAALALLSAGMVVVSCRPAAYEIIKPKKTPVAQPQPRPPLGASSAPSARVEVSQGGVVTTRVKVGVPVIVRPSADTMDPDYASSSACANPGISQANYEIGVGSPKAAARSAGCEELAVEHVFAQAGFVEVQLVVTSLDGETATAGATISVVADGDVVTDGGFTVVAEPIIAHPGQNITFTGFCDTNGEHSIRWTFADGETVVGESATRAFSAVGGQKVDAVCHSNISGRDMRAWLTFVIIAPDRPLPGTDRMIPPVKPSLSAFDPCQRPGQNAQQQQPGQGPCTPQPVQQ